jgi:hypothetical protein
MLSIEFMRLPVPGGFKLDWFQKTVTVWRLISRNFVRLESSKFIKDSFKELHGSKHGPRLRVIDNQTKQKDHNYMPLGSPLQCSDAITMLLSFTM